ncbi:hypothetical protein E1B28_005317 [Marasmius oreades]|uniref:Uncharacterized protein n=1 Tax=Marasmius oreades TaxID=181124 RepID=A0A9P8ADV8_9AGAR|nr:uncharacterized protein E1B28_005317 [Marasmius oreades]KAG7098009.1 hypothetical protein E1B28_005317 [Marasmius oreades]
MSFVGSSGFSVQGGAHNYVQGDQIYGNQINNNTTIQIISQRNKKRTKYDEYHEIKRGDIYLLKDLHSAMYPGRWNGDRREWIMDFQAERAFCTAEIRRLSTTSRFTAVSYSGPDLRKVRSGNLVRIVLACSTLSLRHGEKTFNDSSKVGASVTGFS